MTAAEEVSFVVDRIDAMLSEGNYEVLSSFDKLPDGEASLDDLPALRVLLERVRELQTRTGNRLQDVQRDLDSTRALHTAATAYLRAERA